MYTYTEALRNPLTEEIARVVKNGRSMMEGRAIPTKRHRTDYDGFGRLTKTLSNTSRYDQTRAMLPFITEDTT
jgi:hypothetical protein